MKKIKPIMCVNPGYNIVNPTKAEVLSLASEAFAQYPELKYCNLRTNIISYSRSLGSPEGGEIGITFELLNDDVETAIDLLTDVAIDLGQIDVAFLLYDNDTFETCYYIHNGFDEEEGLAISEFRIMNNDEIVVMSGILTENNLFALSLRLQKILETKDTNDYDLAICLEETPNGIEWLTFQNPYQGQGNKEIFRRSVENAIKRLG